MPSQTQSQGEHAHPPSGLPKAEPLNSANCDSPCFGSRLGFPQRRTRRRPFYATQSLRMLSLLPVGGTTVPRLHMERDKPNGMLRVLDRFTGQQLIVYTPRFTQQFRAGHRSGQWYVRPDSYIGATPLSQCFTTPKNAIKGVTTGHWNLPSSFVAAPGKQFHVIYQALVPSLPQES